jgi:hypothetical protein
MHCSTHNCCCVVGDGDMRQWFQLLVSWVEQGAGGRRWLPWRLLLLLVYVVILKSFIIVDNGELRNL